ncbi:hypothetical protein J4437_05070 [Candidatus Woesearchaeota archaeon]|nr:hypothetical protein [Candidatus Woesearchaeota archaeon]
MKEENKSVVRDAINNIVIAPVSRTHLELVTKIAEKAQGLRNTDLTHVSMDPRVFSGGEFCPRFALGGNSPENLNGKNVYLVMTPGPFKEPEAISFRVGIAAQAAYEAGAKEVNLLTTELPYSRQDRGSTEDPKALGEATSARFLARFLTQTAGIKKVFTTHLHSARVFGHYALESGLIHKERPDLLAEEARSFSPEKVNTPQHLDINAPEVQEIGKKVLVSISPHAFLADYILHHSSLVGTPYLSDSGAKIALKAVDKGNRAFIDDVYNSLWLPEALRIYCNKARKAKNSPDPDKIDVEILDVVGNAKNLDGMLEIYGDDGADSAVSLVKSVKWSNEGNYCSKKEKKYGAPSDRMIYFTHPWLGGKSFEDIQRRMVYELPACEFVTTETRHFINDNQYYRFKEKSTVLRLAGLWADVILANELGKDLNTRYTGFGSQEEQHRFISSLYSLKRHSRHFLSDPTEKKKDVTFMDR